jgi:hypothetical protein
VFWVVSGFAMLARTVDCGCRTAADDATTPRGFVFVFWGAALGGAHEVCTVSNRLACASLSLARSRVEVGSELDGILKLMTTYEDGHEL